MPSRDSLNPRQRRFVQALLVTPTITEAARQAEVSERSARRYIHNHSVRAALHEAQDDLLATVARRAVATMGEALSTLESIMIDPSAPPANRVHAARACLDVALKLAEEHSLAERVATLEARLGVAKQ